ncbi:MAG: hypothetical protein GY750_20110 [Lentisphaerae bacterium]|nr:hypothetical protein [Lentisphaerota bacterium]MCP4103699.1 hypothetical protein [Lentisphaerota bacterium]
MSCKMLIFLLFIFASTFLNAGTVALVGASEGQDELKLITNEILDTETQQYKFKNLSATFPFDNLSDYSLIIAAVRFSNTPTQEQLTKLRKWIEDGGNLILISTVPNSFAKTPEQLDKDHLMAWAGVWKVIYRAKGINCVVQVPENQALNGVDLTQEPKWFKAQQLIWHYRNMQNIIGNEKYCLVGYATVNAGSVSFLGYELNKLRSDKLDSGGRWFKILKNIIEMAELPQYKHPKY